MQVPTFFLETHEHVHFQTVPSSKGGARCEVGSECCNDPHDFSPAKTNSTAVLPASDAERGFIVMETFNAQVKPGGDPGAGMYDWGGMT